LDAPLDAASARSIVNEALVTSVFFAFAVVYTSTPAVRINPSVPITLYPYPVVHTPESIPFGSFIDFPERYVLNVARNAASTHHVGKAGYVPLSCWYFIIAVCSVVRSPFRWRSRAPSDTPNSLGAKNAIRIPIIVITIMISIRVKPLRERNDDGVVGVFFIKSIYRIKNYT
jgi:hypothetical protein